MFESLGLEDWTPLGASLVAGMLFGLLFGVLAQRSRFCLRRGLVGEGSDRAQALGLWLTALATAIVGTQLLLSLELVDFSEQRFFASGISVPAIVLGGLLFGTGMVFARGCASRLTVLAGSGNLRALTAIILFAIVAHATLKGALAPLRVWVSSASISLETTTLTSLPGGGFIWSAIAVALIAMVILRNALTQRDAIFGVLIGALIPLGWFTTGALLFDEFDPITLESLAFTSSSSEALFWSVAGTAIEPGFGVGLFGGVIVGSALAALFFGEFSWQGFDGGVPTHRYLVGGSLMGVGGVLAGGCTVGAGLSGMSTLSFAAMLALGSIVIGALVANAMLNRRSILAVPAE